MRRKLLSGKMIGVHAVLLVLMMTAGYAEEEAKTDAMANHSSNQESKTITASTAEEFVDAIGSNTIILLSNGIYNLSETHQGGFPTDEKYWEDVYDGKKLVIRGVHNLTIKGESPDCKIVVDPRDAAILSFLNCTDITIENVTAGHTIQSGPCEGGVLHFEDCSDIQIVNTQLFGCDAYGLYFNSVKNAKVENSSIYECTSEIMAVPFVQYNVKF